MLAVPTLHSQNWSILQARKYGFNGKIIVPVRSPGDEEHLKLSGADFTYDPYEATAIGVKQILVDKTTKVKRIPTKY